MDVINMMYANPLWTTLWILIVGVSLSQAFKL